MLFIALAITIQPSYPPCQDQHPEALDTEEPDNTGGRRIHPCPVPNNLLEPGSEAEY